MTDAATGPLTEEEQTFIAEFRAWLAENLPPEWAEQGRTLRFAGDRSRIVAREWHRRMYEGGWIAIGWPREWGGRDATVRERVLFNLELAKAQAPQVDGWMGLEFVGQTLLHFGTEEQKRELLPKILRGEPKWAMGYSEPDAGSDLASLKTRAEVDGDELVVNGVKLWNHASHEDWMFTLVRTDPEVPKHKGISYLLIDMSLPGIGIRKLPSLVSSEGFSEVTFENVRVPRRYMVGQLNEGWRVAMTSLAFDRATQGATIGVANLLNTFHRTMQGTPGVVDGSAAKRLRLADRYTDVEVSRGLDDRNVRLIMNGVVPGAEGSESKLFYSELEQRAAENALSLLGLYGQLLEGSPHAVDEGMWQHEFLFSKALTIAGGSSEVIRTTLAQRMCGLPRG